MRTEELITELEGAEETVSEYGVQRLSKVTQYYESQMEFLDKLEVSIEKGKKMLNADLVVRRKHAIKHQKILKKMHSFFNEIDNSYKREEIQDMEGKVFARAYKKAAHEHFDDARKQLSEIENMIKAYKRFVKLKEEGGNRKKKLMQRKSSIQHLLEESNTVELVDKDFTKKHEKAVQGLERINELRMEYIQKISGKNTLEYAEMIKNKDLISAGFPSTDPANLIDFLNSYPEILNATPQRLLEYQSMTDGKLKHVIPETSKFRDIMRDYSSWLNGIKNLELSEFMIVKNAEDAKRLTPLFKDTEAGDVLLNLSELKEYWVKPQKNSQTNDTSELKRELAELNHELTLLEDI